MHYKNGRLAKEGDKVVGVDASGFPVAGILVNPQAGSNTCNGRVVPTQVGIAWVSIKDLVHADDIKEVPLEETKVGL